MSAVAAMRQTKAMTPLMSGPMRCGKPRMPVRASSARSGRTFVRCAATPSRAPAAITHGAGHTGVARPSAAMAGRSPKLTANGRKERALRLRPAL
ncbi:ATP-dependent DNA helicase [Leifsonia xyli subsp. cynodontis DSM 46306]|jgi:hypothetical protein|uniref:Uncharacterized protein n=1 Tax=Leifsonia xyli subsp. cynodontis DSM 46306 TaxID=1389489 RepID=U3P7V9_LEIXC|nr:ATP-dependent DNA helicase [Leifsonia xyli subsp. cynodontis DSM 46306]